MREYLPDKEVFTGWSLLVEVKYLLEGGKFGIPQGYVIMSIEKLNFLNGSGCMAHKEAAENALQYAT